MYWKKTLRNGDVIVVDGEGARVSLLTHPGIDVSRLSEYNENKMELMLCAVFLLFYVVYNCIY
jgi:hypothetical protein